MAWLDFRKTNLTRRFACFTVFDVIKKSIPRFAVTQYNILNNLTRQVCPMWFYSLFQFGNVPLQTRNRHIFAEPPIIPTVKTQNMHMNLPHIINHITNLNRVRLVLKFKLVRFSHGISHITPFYPLSVGWQTRHQAAALIMFASVIVLIIPQFYTIVKSFFDTTIGGVYIPALKVYLAGLTPKIMLNFLIKETSQISESGMGNCSLDF